MKIVIFGANGLTGNELVKQALENEHNVTALARNPSSIEIKYENLAIKQANILSVNSFENTFKGADVIISTVGTGASIKKVQRFRIVSLMHKRFLCLILYRIFFPLPPNFHLSE